MRLWPHQHVWKVIDSRRTPPMLRVDADGSEHFTGAYGFATDECVLCKKQKNYGWPIGPQGGLGLIASKLDQLLKQKDGTPPDRA